MRQELGTAGCLALPRGCFSLVPLPAAGDLTWHCTGVSLVLWTGSATLSPAQVNAQLASLGTRLSCSSLIYYKGDGDKQPREPLRVQCPCGCCPSQPQSGLITGAGARVSASVGQSVGRFSPAAPSTGEHTMSG